MPVKNLDNERTLRALRTEKPQEDFRDASWKNTGSFGVRVARTGKKVFFLTYTISGKERRLKLGEYPAMTLAKAKVEALQAIARVGKGENPAEEKQAHKLAETCDEVFESFIQHRQVLNSKGRRPTAETTLKNFRSMYMKDVEPRIGKMKAVDVTRAHVIAIINQVFERGAGVQSNRLKEMLSAMFSFAVDQALVQAHPCFRIKDKAAEQVGKRYLNADEIKAYWNHSAELSTENRVYLRLLLLTGMRPGEVMKLRWSFIDGEVLTLPSEIVKTDNVHELYLSPLARAELQLLKADSRGGDFLFPGNGRETARKDFEDGRKKIAEKMKCSDWTLRDIRRTVETGMRALKIPGEHVSEVLNHGRDKIRKHYDKNTYFSEKKSALIKWAEWIVSTAKEQDGSNVRNLEDYRRQSNE